MHGALISQLTQGGHAATCMVSDRQDRRKSRCCDSRHRRDACNRQRDFRRPLCVLRYFHGRPCGLLGAVPLSSGPASSLQDSEGLPHVYHRPQTAAARRASISWSLSWSSSSLKRSGFSGISITFGAPGPSRRRQVCLQYGMALSA
jgi:hypothetical protein